MKDLDDAITNSANLDESMSNANGYFSSVTDFLKDPKNIRNTLLMGPAGAVVAAADRAKKAKKAADAADAAQKEIAAAELEAANIALAQAQAELEASKMSSTSSSNIGSSSKTSDTKKFPWLLVGGITFGVLALATTAYFVFRKKK